MAEILKVNDKSFVTGDVLKVGKAKVAFNNGSTGTITVDTYTDWSPLKLFKGLLSSKPYNVFVRDNNGQIANFDVDARTRRGALRTAVSVYNKGNK